MGQRSKVEGLPADVRAEVDGKLFQGGFSGYEHLERWLAGKGYQIGKSSLHRYGSKLEERMAQLKASTDQARALVAASPDDSGDLVEATMRLMQDKLFNLLMEIDIDPESADLPKIARALAPLARAQIGLRRFKDEVKSKLQKVLDEAETKAGTGTDPMELVRMIRERAYGIYE
jgi:hypothetical protein